MVEITDQDIIYAEKILLKENQHFDAERIKFIKDFSTLDLQAVPGSGKTTALLAKLLIIDKKMPLQKGAGVLVISHTNAAVDEIYSKIGNIAPKLFQYPNFIGTIQNFIDTFLAIPFYINKLKKKPYRIDNEIYNEKINKILNNIWFHKEGASSNTLNHISHIKNANDSLFYSYRFDLIDGKTILTNTQNGEKLEIKKPRGNTKHQNYVDYTDEEKGKIYNWFFRIRNFIIRKEGVLSFDDAYFLAKCYIKKYPSIVPFVQNRFKYVFVDEMQDMDVHQINILENVFFNNGISKSNFQRIGDINQAIYNGNSIHINNIWNNREKTLEIKGSHRLNKYISPIVEKLGLSHYDIKGCDLKTNNKEIVIKPHIIVFNNDSIENVIPKFAEIIKNMQALEKIPIQSEHKFMALAWRKEHLDQDKIGLTDYWKKYSSVISSKKTEFIALKDYLINFDNDINNLGIISKQIINALNKILRLENIVDEKGRMYTKSTIINHLKDIENYEDFKLKIYKWSISIVNNEISETYNAIKDYISSYLSYFGKTITNSKDFIEGDPTNILVAKEKDTPNNIYEKDNIRIEVGTIHSAKGQTHTATLYLETFFQGKYESEYLKNVFEGKAIKGNGVYAKQAMKMSYVGFSRPTHLLCFAVHKDRFLKYINNIVDSSWEIVDISL